MCRQAQLHFKSNRVHYLQLKIENNVVQKELETEKKERARSISPTQPVQKKKKKKVINIGRRPSVPSITSVIQIRPKSQQHSVFLLYSWRCVCACVCVGRLRATTGGCRHNAVTGSRRHIYVCLLYVSGPGSSNLIYPFTIWRVEVCTGGL